VKHLRVRYLAAMGLPLAACPAPESKQPNVEIAQPSALPPVASVSATPSATATATATASAPGTATATATAMASVAAPAVRSWDITFPNVGGPNWCPTKDARCMLEGDLGKSCPKTYTVPCGCTPGTACMRADDPCDAPYVKTVSAQETGKKKKTACCYEMPQHCIAPWVGRVYEPVQPVMRSDDDWEAMALGEWASVASFARASLELLSLGAPPDLIADTHRAALDEIEHARFAYAKCGKTFEPIPIAELRKPTMAEFTVSTFLEACLPETAGAEEMHRRGIDWIAEDEERHADLAWRTLAWAVRESEEAREALLEAIANVRSDHPVVTEVVIPCALALAREARPTRPG